MTTSALYEFGVYFRGTNLLAEGPTIWAKSEAEAKRILKK